MHPTDDVHARGALMVARAAAVPSRTKFPTLADFDQACAEIRAIHQAEAQAATIRALAASDAALARAIDAVPGRG